MRRAADQEFTRGSVKRYQEKQMAQGVVLGCEWLSEPVEWDGHLCRSGMSMMLSVVYGQSKSRSEEYQTARVVNDLAHRIMAAASTGAHLVEFFPWMRYIPSR
jgi:hypothetical protein